MTGYLAMQSANANDAAAEAARFVLGALRRAMELAAVRYGLVLLTRKHTQQATTLADIAVAELADAEPVGLTTMFTSSLDTAFDSLIPGDDVDPFALPPAQAQDLLTGIERLAHAVVLDTGTDALSAAIKEQPAVTGWRRYVHPDCCPRCQALATDQVFAEDTEFWTVHPNDRCIPVPVTESEESA